MITFHVYSTLIITIVVKQYSVLTKYSEFKYAKGNKHIYPSIQLVVNVVDTQLPVNAVDTQLLVIAVDTQLQVTAVNT